MASVWKRLQRVNKRAAKFQYTASYHRIDLETSPKWKPNKLSIVWTRRSRRVVTEPLEWEPSLKDPLKGSVIFPVPENRSVAVTLFKDSRTNELEDKDWTFVIDDVSLAGKRRRLASCEVNMRRYASLAPAQFSLSLALQPLTQKVVSASIQLTLHSVLLREGRATDEDMQSLASLLSVNNNSDVAVLEDLDDEDYTLSDHSAKQVLDFRQQMEEMTQSLTNSDIAATPNSVQSLSFDNCRTPTANTPNTPNTPHTQTPNTPTNPTPQDNPIELQISELPDLKINFKTSTPKFESQNNLKTEDGLKVMTFKPKTMTKMNLKPLDLKINLNNIGLDATENGNDGDNTPVIDEKLLPARETRSGGKTPVAELLEWAQEATRDYPSVKVTDLSTSFRSGLALCAIIHHFRPDLIDYSGLQPDAAADNVRCALAAAASLRVAAVLAPPDVVRARPDKLAIMTFLFQLRAHFTGSELQVEQLGGVGAASSYVVGRHDTDGALPLHAFSREVLQRRSQRQQRSQPRSLLAAGAAALGRALSPPRSPPPASPASPAAPAAPASTWYTEPPPRPEKLMTRKELTDPFASDEEDDQTNTHTNCDNTHTNNSSTHTEKDALHINNNSLHTNSDNATVQNTTSERESNSHEKEESDAKHSPPALSTSERLLSDPLTLLAREQDQLSHTQQMVTDSATELPKPTPQLLSRHDELKERARLLLEATKREAREKDKKRQNSKERDEIKNDIMNGLSEDSSPTNRKPMSDEERQTVLRERARKLIADARAGVVSGSSPAVEVISRRSVLQQIQAGGLEQLDELLNRSDSFSSSPSSRHSRSPPPNESDGGSNKSPLKTFNELLQLDRGRTPTEEEAAEGEVGEVAEVTEVGEGASYIQSELAALEREQRQVDAAAAALERTLRAVMLRADAQEEDRLMSQWFNLVNKKNALLRRQMQLNILEQEEDLSRRCELLARELRLSLHVDEWRKTPGQKRRERLLLQELVSAVNERDRLVQEMDEQEKAIADDDAIERNLSQVDLQRKNNCILQ